ncbi:MAG TPA: xanthine dehydrogenase family protein molybdopterin-binding subunit, partial [Thermoanaerobaculia bacterium]
MIPEVGAPLDRLDGKKKVTGGAKYAAENRLENAAYGVLVMSTIPSGTIRSIDDRAARKSPGVIDVISHVNSPKMQKPKGGSLRETELIPFTDNSVHYVGQRIAIVVADTLEHATRGAELVKVTYDETPARVDLDKLKSEAFDRAKSAFTKGDADAAFADAAVRVDQVYRTPHEHHNPLEAHSCIAAWNGDHLTLYDSSQNIFGGQQALAQMFGILKENVHVMSQFVGGAFGSKGGLWPHVPIAAVAAKVVQRPVKVVVTRKQLFFANGHRPECVQHVALGANSDGKLVALIHDGYSQSNDVCDYSERFTRPTKAIYAAENMKVVNPVVSLNLPSPTFMRAPGENPGMFAIESAMDELAVALKMDPVQLRLVNYADVSPENGKPWSSKSLKECYAQAAEKFGWSKRNPEPRSMRKGRDLIGWGMASATYPSHRSPASARAVMNADGTVTVSSGTHEMGMGTATVLAQLAAE